MSNYHITYLEPVPPDVEMIIRSCLPGHFKLRVRRADETVSEAITNADFVLVATTPLTAEVIKAAPKLRLIQHQGVGYDKTDIEAAATRGIPVALCPTGTSVGVAEHVFLLILALYKRLLLADTSLRQGRWLQWELRPTSYEIAGKTIGILGLGRIGQEVAKRAIAFNAKVIYYDTKRASGEAEDTFRARFVPLDELLSSADIISLHIPYFVENYHCIGAREIEKMKRTAILINTARGSLVDEKSLLEALLNERILGAGMDVFENEPLPPDHPFLKLSNIVLTPHISAGTKDALVAKMKACFENMIRMTRDQPLLDVVNMKGF